MYVVKRNGRIETVKFDAITARILQMCYGLDSYISPELIAIRVISHLYRGISTAQIDVLIAQVAFAHARYHPDYALLSSRIAVSNLHKQTPSTFSEAIERMHASEKLTVGTRNTAIAEDIYELVCENKDFLNASIIDERDFLCNYPQLSLFTDRFLMHIAGQVVERVQYMFMRVALGIHKNDLTSVLETYTALSQGKLLLSSPTLCSSGTNKAQMMPHFMTSVKERELSQLHEVINLYAHLSASTSQTAIHLHETSVDIQHLLALLQTSVNYVHHIATDTQQTLTINIALWHSGIETVLHFIRQTTTQNTLKFVLWLPNLFFERLHTTQKWTLMSPEKCPNLSQAHGEEFEQLYLQYEERGLGEQTVNIEQLWDEIIATQLEVGMPHIVYQDATNSKFNQQHIHTVQQSCWSGGSTIGAQWDETIGCAGASVALPKCIDGQTSFSHDHLFELVYLAVINLNKIIDSNAYPSDATMRFNLRHRPMSIGVDGLHDVFLTLELPVESIHAQQLNKDIFETVYFAALTASNDLAQIDGAYSSFDGSLLSRGMFQFDKWNISPSDRWDWSSLREHIVQYGVRNALLVGIAPTPFDTQTTGYSANCQPYASYIEHTSLDLGEVITINNLLARKLVKHGLWSKELVDTIIQQEGSVQHIPEIDVQLKEIYKNGREIDQRYLIDLNADRGAYICQSQPLAIYLSDSTSLQALSSLHQYAWQKGLKTSITTLY